MDTPTDKIRFMVDQFAETTKAYINERKWYNSNNNMRIEIFVGWEPPPADWVTLNMDGASRQNPDLAGCGGVFRGGKGEWLGGFAEKLGICSSVRAELRAVLRRLLLARDKGFKKIIIFVDSIMVMGMLKGDMDCNARHHTIIQCCKSLMEANDWEVRISHCYREANQVADTLANLGIELTCSFAYFNEPPREVSPSLYADQIGVKFPRFIVNQ